MSSWAGDGTLGAESPWCNQQATAERSTSSGIVYPPVTHQNPLPVTLPIQLSSNQRHPLDSRLNRPRPSTCSARCRTRASTRQRAASLGHTLARPLPLRSCRSSRARRLLSRPRSSAANTHERSLHSTVSSALPVSCRTRRTGGRESGSSRVPPAHRLSRSHTRRAISAATTSGNHPSARRAVARVVTSASTRSRTLLSRSRARRMLITSLGMLLVLLLPLTIFLHFRWTRHHGRRSRRRFLDLR